MKPAPDVMTEQELATRWKMSLSNVQRLRLDGKGPAFFRPGGALRGRVLYRIDAVLAYEQAKGMEV